MIDGRESPCQGLSKSPTQIAMDYNAVERRGKACKHSFIVEFSSIIFIAVACGEFLWWG